MQKYFASVSFMLILFSVSLFSQNSVVFKEVKTFSVNVPATYNTATQLDSFSVSANKDDFINFYDSITDANYAKVTTQLMPGASYMVTIYEGEKTVSTEDCMQFLKSKNAMLVGAQGLSLLYQLKKDDLPTDKLIFSFDNKNSLWFSSYYKCSLVPFLILYSDYGNKATWSVRPNGGYACNGLYFVCFYQVI